MKRKSIVPLLAVAALLLAAGCGKQKDCRCAVRGASTVRIVKIDKGECEQIRTYSYHNEVDSLRVDSLRCTGQEFAIDSIFND